MLVGMDESLGLALNSEEISGISDISPPRVHHPAMVAMARSMDGFDDCILGVASRFGSEAFVIYDYDKVIAQLESYGMTYEEAVEYHEFNQLGAYVGERTPAA